MTTLQKLIKYFALAFALFIIVNIISGVLFGIYTFANLLGLKKSEPLKTGVLNEIGTNIEDSQITTLKIELQYTNLRIQKGETLKVESNNSAITCMQNNHQLIIKEKNHNWVSKHEEIELIIYIPENIIFDNIKMKTGAGEIDVEILQAKELDFEMGAGKAKIKNLKILDKAKIDGGAGKLEILNGEIRNLDLDMGVGENILKTKLSGNSEIDAGVGKIEIDLIEELENYTIKVSKGIGSIKIDGKEVTDNTIYGRGENYIKIDGGIGAIIIE